MKSYSHQLTDQEFEDVKILGFKVSTTITDIPGFVNMNFPNLDLLKWAKECQELLEHLATKPVEKGLYFREPPPTFELEILSEDWSDKINGLAYSRKFVLEKGDIAVFHNYLTIPLKDRKKGIAKKVLRASTQQYLNTDVKKLKVRASLEDGGLVWTKWFFTADYKSDMDVILQKAKLVLSRPQYEAVERIFDNYYTKNPSGTAFPIEKWAELPFMEVILRGSEWTGTVDFMNSDQFSNFMKYVVA